MLALLIFCSKDEEAFKECLVEIINKDEEAFKEAIFAALQELFDLPLQTKILNVSKKPYHGYVGQYPMVPLFESMGIDDANVYENVESMTNIMWPHGNPSFRHVPIKI